MSCCTNYFTYTCNISTFIDRMCAFALLQDSVVHQTTCKESTIITSQVKKNSLEIHTRS
eukprot:m.102170 g.102170  ORF g.102170 m.102170 type:complete len:59 (-) comp13762_c0_seq2:84-260(-)